MTDPVVTASTGDSTPCQVCHRPLSEARAALGLTVCSGPCHKAAFTSGGPVQVTCPTCGADFTTHPDRLPNHVYYTHTMVTKRVRVIVDADVEWREDDPTYSLSAAELDIQNGAGSVRVRNVTPVSSEFLGEVCYRCGKRLRWWQPQAVWRTVHMRCLTGRGETL